MQLTTKYEIGDTAWIIENNKPTSAKICGVKVKSGRVCYTNGTHYAIEDVNYFLEGNGDIPFRELNIYSTKEELLADFAK